MNKVRFYRVESLPQEGVLGSLYFVYSGANPKLYICTANGFEQYSDLFDRDFSTLSVDAIANAGDGVVYFTPDTHQIIKDGVVYGYEDLTGYVTEQWIENKGYLTEHQDISGKVDVTDFEEASFVTSAALNYINSNKQDQLDNTLQTTSKTIVGAINELASQIGQPVGNLNIDLQTTEQDALVGDQNIIYFTSDTKRIIYQGKIFSKEGYVYDTSLNSFSINTGRALGNGSSSEGNQSQATGDYSHAEGSNTIAEGHQSHAEGNGSHSSGQQSHAEGTRSVATGNQSHAEGYETTAVANGSHSEGDSTIAYGKYSHTEGGNSVTGYNGVLPASNNRALPDNSEDANGGYAHAEGASTIAAGKAAHSEGCLTYAKSDYSHAEGYKTLASGFQSHAEGNQTTSEGQQSHAEGAQTLASGRQSHSEGFGTKALAN